MPERAFLTNLCTGQVVSGGALVHDRSCPVHPESAEVVALRRKLAAADSVLADRERELLELKGPCGSVGCRLHYAHSGPCDVKTPVASGR